MQPGFTSGVDILKIFANVKARERESAIVSGSPMGVASHFDRSSCTWRPIDTIDSEAGLLAPEMRIDPRPSIRCLKLTLSPPSRLLSGKCRAIAAVPFSMGVSFSFDQRLAFSSVG